MPHSHGGGSSGGFGGGGGGGGFRSGGSRRSSGPRYSKNRYFPGARRYYYINPLGARCYFYYGGVPKRQTVASVVVPLVVALFILVIVTVALLVNTVPFKLGASRCTYNGTFIEDPDNFFSDTDEQTLKTSLNAFYKKTGIEPYVYVFDTKRMPELETAGSYSGANLLERFAYDKYLDLFDDEGHYLIVMALETDDEGKIAEWMWIDMAGDNTDRIIDNDAFDDFQRSMQYYLGADQTSKAVAVSKAFDESTKTIMKLSPNDTLSLGFALVFIFVFFCVLVSACVKGVKQVKEINAYCDYRDRNGGVDFVEGEELSSVVAEDHNPIGDESDVFDTDTATADYEHDPSDTDDDSTVSSSGSDLFD